MAEVPFDRLSQAEGRRADFLITCRGCRRVRLFERATFLAIICDKRLRDERARVERRMRCFECYARGATIELVPEGSAAAMRLREGDPLPPKGISISDWCAAGSHERRRRLIRRARD